MVQRDLIAIGASAGGFRAVRTLLQGLPRDLPATILVTLHLSPNASASILPSVVGTGSSFPAAFARDGERMERGRVYVAPPDRHLLVDGEQLLVRHGPLENGSRPAIDPMFRSVAYHFRGRAVGVLLTGYLDDGVSGLIAIRRCGGLVIVQDPADAEVPDMPRNAIERLEPDHVAPLADIADMLRKVVGGPAGPMTRPPRDLEMEVRMAAQGGASIDVMEQLGSPSPFTCPECHGHLREIPENGHVRYRCHTGHAYSLDSLALAQNQELERALASALRALDERIGLLRRLSRDAGTAGRNSIADQFARRAGEYESQAAVIRNLLMNRGQLPRDAGPEPATIAPAVPTALRRGQKR